MTNLSLSLPPHCVNHHCLDFYHFLVFIKQPIMPTLPSSFSCPSRNLFWWNGLSTLQTLPILLANVPFERKAKLSPVSNLARNGSRASLATILRSSLASPQDWILNMPRHLTGLLSPAILSSFVILSPNLKFHLKSSTIWMRKEFSKGEEGRLSSRYFILHVKWLQYYLCSANLELVTIIECVCATGDCYLQVSSLKGNRQ
jgi:hypothetical protein